MSLADSNTKRATSSIMSTVLLSIVKAQRGASHEHALQRGGSGIVVQYSRSLASQSRNWKRTRKPYCCYAESGSKVQSHGLLWDETYRGVRKGRLEPKGRLAGDCVGASMKGAEEIMYGLTNAINQNEISIGKWESGRSSATRMDQWSREGKRMGAENRGTDKIT